MNYERYCAVLEHIEQHPEQWDQFHPWYGDGSSPYCILGHAQRFGGYPWQRSSLVAGGEYLQLSDEMADWMWDPSRTLDELRAVRLVAGMARFPTTH